MTAHERYQFLVGEIGIDRDKYLYELPYWEIFLIARGYSHRNREMWSAIRWATFYIMSCSMANLKEAGIYRPTDLLQFPWEKSSSLPHGNMPSDDEIAEAQRVIQEENERLAREAKEGKPEGTK